MIDTILFPFIVHDGGVTVTVTPTLFHSMLIAKMEEKSYLVDECPAPANNQRRPEIFTSLLDHNTAK